MKRTHDHCTVHSGSIVCRMISNVSVPAVEEDISLVARDTQRVSLAPSLANPSRRCRSHPSVSSQHSIVCHYDILLKKVPVPANVYCSAYYYLTIQCYWTGK